MLIRNVLIANDIYSAHVITSIAINDGEWAICVHSYKTIDDVDSFGASYISRVFSKMQNTIEEYNEAYDYISTLPEFEEYVDVLEEVLPILTDEQAEQVPNAFPEWKLDTDYTVGYRVRYSENLYKCLQNHTSQIGYEPPIAVSLWAKIGEPGTIPEWEQPSSTNPYMTGDLVRHNNKIWRSLIDNNVWEPGTPGTEVLWEEVLQ